MCVGFLYTLVVWRPSCSFETSVLTKTSLLSLSVSIVKWKEDLWFLREGGKGGGGVPITHHVEFLN